MAKKRSSDPTAFAGLRRSHSLQGGWQQVVKRPRTVVHACVLLLVLWLTGCLDALAFSLKTWRVHDGPHHASSKTGVRGTDTGTITWTACSDAPEFQCGRLEVPMDFSNSTYGRRVSLALRKLPASCSKSDYLGTLLTYPGGPSESGHAFALSAGAFMSTVLDGRYDIIGFDPRGVNMTTPSLPQPLEGRNGTFLPGEVPTAIEDFNFDGKLAMLKAMMDSCYEQGDHEMLRGASTAYTARDMASILDAIGQHHLHYWGFSYASALGATFAAMFPARVGRMVNDGVLDAKMYTNTNLHDNLSLQDWSKTYAGFVKRCNDYPEQCSMGALRDLGIPSIDTAIQTLASRLARAPAPVTSAKNGPGVFTATTLANVLMESVYWPNGWSRFSNGVIDALVHGNFTSLYDTFMGEHPSFDRMLKHETSAAAKDTRMSYTFDYHVAGSIRCADSPRVPQRTREEQLVFSLELARLAPGVGEKWVLIGLMQDYCRLTPRDAYHGPWSRAEGLAKPAFPLLFIGSTADPVTPGHSAFDMARAFGGDGAVAILHDGFGHTSLAQPSLCTINHIKAYLTAGTLPVHGTKCSVQQDWPFLALDYTGLSKQDAALLRAMETFSKTT